MILNRSLIQKFQNFYCNSSFTIIISNISLSFFSFLIFDDFMHVNLNHYESAPSLFSALLKPLQIFATKVCHYSSSHHHTWLLTFFFLPLLETNALLVSQKRFLYSALPKKLSLDGALCCNHTSEFIFQY